MEVPTKAPWSGWFGVGRIRSVLSKKGSPLERKKKTRRKQMRETVHFFTRPVSFFRICTNKSSTENLSATCIIPCRVTKVEKLICD